MHQVGKASLLSHDRSPLQLGPVYINSAWYFFAVGNGLKIDPKSNQLSAGTNTVSVVQTSIVFDHLFRRDRLALQYQPRLAILNGQVQRDLSSYALALNGSHMFSPRWNLAYSNTYGSTRNRLLYGDSYFNVDLVTTDTFQTPFLETRERFISNYSDATLSYQMTARDKFSLESRLNYTRSTFLSAPTNSYTYGASFKWDRSLSPTRGFGLAYVWEKRQFSRALTNTDYQSIGAGFTQQIARTWHLRAGVGAGTAADRSLREWTLTGSFSVLKTFRKSYAAVNAYRSNEFGGFVTNRWTDRADAYYGMRLTRRWGLGASGGYYHVGLPERVSGTYAGGQASYQLLRRVSTFVSFGHKWQAGRATDLLFTGGRSYFAIGLRWDAHPDSAY